MSITLQFRVVNASPVDYATVVDIDGEPATAIQPKAVIEAEPLAAAGKLLTFVLGPEALADFPEGSTINVTVEAVTETQGA